MQRAKHSSQLAHVVQSMHHQAMWPTPTTRDWKDGTAESVKNVPLNSLLGRAVHGLTAQTESKGSLNPQFVCWLMGYPQEHLNCAPMETPLSRRLRRNSLKQALKQSGTANE
jgi:hypothetical protein